MHLFKKEIVTRMRFTDISEYIYIYMYTYIDLVKFSSLSTIFENVFVKIGRVVIVDFTDFQSFIIIYFREIITTGSFKCNILKLIFFCCRQSSVITNIKMKKKHVC